MAEGKIKHLADRGFGFITRDGDGQDVFFHMSALLGVPFDALRKGDRVRFEVHETAGRLAATDVEPIAGASAPTPTAAGGRGVGTARPDRSPKDHQATAGDHADYHFYNPYNFVRFLEPAPAETATPGPTPASGGGSMAQQFAAAGYKQSRRDPSAVALLGRCAPPTHDRYVGLTGRIECSLEAITPLFVSDSEGVTGNDKHRTYRFYRRNGALAIPGSSLRGMVRGLFEAATNSCMIHLAGDVRLTRHTTTQESLALVPARVVKMADSETGLGLDLLTGNTDLAPGKKPNGPQYAAWLGRYIGETLRDSRNVPGNHCYGRRQNLDVSAYRDKPNQPLWALLRPYQHPERNFQFFAVQALAAGKADLPKPNAAAHEIVGEGYLHITNQNIENKHDERFFFRADGRARQPLVPIPQSGREPVKQRYKELIEDYQDRHADDIRGRVRAGLDPALPDRSNGNPRKHRAGLSAHILDPRAKGLKEGDLVYVQLNEARECKFIGPVSIPRIAFRDRIADRLPHRFGDERRLDLPGNLAPCDDLNHLCPACRTFGWVRPGSDHEAARQNQPKQDGPAAYAGRLRFGEAHIEKDNGTLPPTPLAILSTPKPTTARFYLEHRTAGDQSTPSRDSTWPEQSAVHAYDEGMNRLRGRKFYRHHPMAVEQEYRRAQGRADDQNRTVADALKPGARFRFQIDFENLAALELGALLWSLDLDGRGCHRLGYGKPLGFGSVRLKVETIDLLDAAARYQSVEPNAGWVDARHRKDQWAGGFKDALAAVYPEGANGFDGLPNIVDLMTLLTAPAPGLPIHYPRTGPISDPEGKNFEWFMGNKRVGLVLPSPPDDEGFPLLDRRSGLGQRR